MPTHKSPGGSIFPFPYKGGELFGLHFGSFFADEERLLRLMKAEEQFLSDQHHALPLWVDFYETWLTERVTAAFLTSLKMLNGSIYRAFIFCCSNFRQLRRE